MNPHLENRNDEQPLNSLGLCECDGESDTSELRTFSLEEKALQEEWIDAPPRKPQDGTTVAIDALHHHQTLLLSADEAGRNQLTVPMHFGINSFLTI